MHASDLRGRAVVTLADAAKVGTVGDVLFDAQYRRVLGFRVKKSLMGKETVPRTKVQSVGADALIVSAPEAVNAEKRFTELAGATSLKDFTDTKVLSEGGDYVGMIRDVTWTAWPSSWWRTCSQPRCWTECAIVSHKFVRTQSCVSARAAS